jgi:hypothetical protein
MCCNAPVELSVDGKLSVNPPAGDMDIDLTSEELQLDDAGVSSDGDEEMGSDVEYAPSELSAGSALSDPQTDEDVEMEEADGPAQPPKPCTFTRMFVDPSASTGFEPMHPIAGVIKVSCCAILYAHHRSTQPE